MQEPQLPANSSWKKGKKKKIGIISRLRNAAAHLPAAGLVACNLLEPRRYCQSEVTAGFSGRLLGKTRLHGYNSQAG